MKTFEVTKDYTPETFSDFLYDFLPEDYAPKKQQAYFDYTNIEEGYKLGTCKSLNLDVYEFRTKSKRDPRVTLTREVVSLMKKYGYNQNALVVFYSKKSHNWRLSLITTDYEVVNDKVKPLYSNPRRFSFRLGAECKAHTPQTMLFKKGPINKHTENGKEITTLEDLKSRFALEVVSKQFFNEYKVFYEDFVQYITGNRYVKTGKKGKYERKSVSKENTRIFSQFKKIAYGDYDLACKYVRDYVKKFMGRLVFLQFLQKKGWLGVEENDSWGSGNKNFLLDLFSSTKYKNDFLKKVLEPLFFGMLNTDLRDRKKLFNSKEWDVSLLDDFKQIPYLNGGLFEDDILDSIDIKFPKEMFSNPAKAEKERTFNDKKDYTKEPYPFTECCGLLDFFARYNFTIDETDPADMEIGVEPEMLGKIFENLLEDNKDKGAFYTPKEIVQYMCRESLIEYLKDNRHSNKESHSNEESHSELDSESKIRTLVTNHIADFNDTEKKELLKKLKTVKICDPAVGSGAFPMGMLNELFACRLALGENEDAAEIKKQIVRENIYGVDIEKGAVDIARLRFWLAIIVDEKEPIPLPNLDYKIMQGNSLLESYEGIDLSKLTKSNDELFDNAEIIQQLRDAIDGFYIPCDHIAKAKIRKQIREKVIQLLKDRQLPPATIKKLESIDLHSNSDFFLWHTWFSDVFNRPGKNGFDIVIGNPPYVKEYTNKSAFNGFRENSPYYIGKMDLWYGFACHGLDLLKPNGILCFIAQNNWTTSDGAKLMRKKVIDDTRIKQLLDFNTYMIFENADIQTMVMLFEHNNNENGYLFDYRTLLAESDKNDMLALLEKQKTSKTKYLKPTIKRENLRGKLLTFSDNESIFDKIADGNSHLNEDEITQGIIGNPDDAFKVNKNEISDYLKSEKQFFHKFHTHTERYGIDTSNTYIIYLSSKETPELRINDYPNIKRKLSEYSKELKNRREVLQGRFDWFFLHWPRREEVFKKGYEKIITQVRCEKPKFCYTTEEYYGSRALFFIQTKRWNMKLLLGILNSKLIDFWLRGKGKIQGNVLKLDKDPLLHIPLPNDIQTEQQPIIALVDKILAAKKLDINADTSDLESQIDELVYTLYGLTEEEKNIIRGK